MKNNRVIKKTHIHLLGMISSAAVILTTYPAFAGTWILPGSASVPITAKSASGLGSAMGTSQALGASTQSLPAKWSTTALLSAVSNGTTTQTAAASVSAGSTTNTLTVGYMPFGTVPPTGVTITSTVTAMWSASAAAGFTVNNLTGQITPLSSCWAEVDSDASSIPANSAHSLSAFLRADSPTAKPSGMASSGASIGGGYLSATHTRGGVYRTGWGSNVDSGMATFTFSATIPKNLVPTQGIHPPLSTYAMGAFVAKSSSGVSSGASAVAAITSTLSVVASP